MSDYSVKVQKHKVDAVNAIKEEFEGVTDYIITDYRGLTVEKITELRDKLREANGVYKVLKNRYAKIALKELGQPEIDSFLVGPTAIALAKDESGPVAKALVEFAKDAPVEIKGGVIAGDIYTDAQVEAFSKLPTKLELISMLMSAMRGPVQNLVYGLNEIPTKLVRTLKAVADQKAEG